VLDCQTTGAVPDCAGEELADEMIEMVEILNYCIPTTIPAEAQPTFDAI